MMAIQLRFDVARELLLLLCLLVLLGSSLGLLRVDFPGLWFALGSVPVVLWVSYRLQRIGELDLARLMRLALAAFAGGVVGANIRFLFCAVVG